MKVDTVYFSLPTDPFSYHTFSRLSLQQALQKNLPLITGYDSSTGLPPFEVSPTMTPPILLLSVSQTTSLCSIQWFILSLRLTLISRSFLTQLIFSPP